MFIPFILSDVQKQASYNIQNRVNQLGALSVMALSLGIAGLAGKSPWLIEATSTQMVGFVPFSCYTLIIVFPGIYTLLVWGTFGKCLQHLFGIHFATYKIHLITSPGSCSFFKRAVTFSPMEVPDGGKPGWAICDYSFFNNRIMACMFTQISHSLVKIEQETNKQYNRWKLYWSFCQCSD